MTLAIFGNFEIFLSLRYSKKKNWPNCGGFLTRKSVNLCRIFDVLTVISAPEPPYPNFKNAETAREKLPVLKFGYGVRAEYLGFSGDRFFFKAVPLWGPFRPRILKIRHKFLENLVKNVWGGVLVFFSKIWISALPHRSTPCCFREKKYHNGVAWRAEAALVSVEMGPARVLWPGAPRVRLRVRIAR